MCVFIIIEQEQENHVIMLLDTHENQSNVNIFTYMKWSIMISFKFLMELYIRIETLFAMPWRLIVITTRTVTPSFLVNTES